MKRLLRKMVVAAIVSLMVFQLTGCSKPVVEPEYADDQHMTIGAWVAPPPEFINDETYKDIADSGINLIYGLYEDVDQNALKALKLAEKYGIEYLVRSRALFSIPEDELELMDGFFDDFKDSPAFRGVLAVDEPGAGKFEKLGILREKFEELLPGKLFYVNLFPTYASIDQRDGRTYKEYIDEYIETVKTDYLSYDHYPLKRNSIDGNYLTEDYLLNLDIVASATRKAGIPFWVFIQSIGYWAAGMENRLPDEKDVRWQVYNSLAFGAEAIQHFTYWTPVGNAETFTDAMVDKVGNKTPLYDAVKNVNNEILAFDHIYLNYKNLGVMTFPEENAPAHLYMENRLAEFKPIKKVTSEHPVVIGAFEDKDGNQAIVLVNYTDPSAELTNKVTIDFDKVREVSLHDSNGNSRVKTSGGKYEVTLQPGEGKFILLLK